MDLAALPPALPALQLPVAPGLVVLSGLGAWLAWRAYRSGTATVPSALLRGSLPSTLWLLVASLNPERPTRLSLTPFGTGLALGFVCGLVAARSAARRAHASGERSVGCYLWSCAAGLASARLAEVLGHLALLPAGRSVAALHGSGLSMNAALLGGVAATWWCFRQQPLRWRAWLDGLAPALGLALALGFLGAYLQDPTRPSQLFAAGAGLALSGAASCLGAWQRFHGQSFVLVALGYGIVQLSMGRASVDPTRGSAGLAIPVAAWLVIALAGAAGWAWHKGLTFRRI